MTHSISEIGRFTAKYRLLFVLGSAALLAELAYAILNLSALPMYVTFTLKEGPALGLILSVFLLTEAVTRPIFGALGDKIGRKPLLIAGPALTAVTAYLTIKLQGPYTVLGLVALRALDGCGSGALWPSAFATIGDIVEEENRSAAMSVLNVTYMGGLSLGFLMGGAVNDYFQTYNASFYLVSVLLLLAVAVLLIFFPASAGRCHHVPCEHHGIEEPTEFKLSNLLRSFHTVPEMIVLACVTFLGMGMLTPIVKLYAVEHLGLSETQFGWLVAPIAAAMGLFAVPLGRMGDRFGMCVAVSWGLFASAIAMWVLALFRSVLLAGIAGIAIGLGFTVAFPAWNALVLSVTRPDRRGEVLGAVGMAQGLAAIIGASLGAFIYNSDLLSLPRLGVVNYNVPFWLSAILLSAGTVITFTWVCSRYTGSDPKGSVTTLQRRFVITAAVLGTVGLAVWVGYRYARPVPADRVAWQWVQQLVRDRPDEAKRFVSEDCPESARAARRFHSWKEKHQARYTVLFPTTQTSKRAIVPVRFTFPGGKSKTELVSLTKNGGGEWKVCGVADGP